MKRENLRKLNILLITFILLFTQVIYTGFSYADENLPSGDEVEKEVTIERMLAPVAYADETPVFTTKEDALQYVRDELKVKSTDIVFIVKGAVGTSLCNNYSSFWASVFDHTGDPEEGDYLYNSWTSAALGYSFVGTTYTFAITSISYYLTNDQEQEFRTEVSRVVDSLNMDQMSEYEKVRTIYSYITDNVVYDYDGLAEEEEDGVTYHICHTAYSALIYKKAVCQGYAVLFYRMALMAGLDARYITGTTSGGAHGWNIVRIGNCYYNVDSTWDAGRTSYRYFLRCNQNFVGHTRSSYYDNDDFNAEYFMSLQDYNVSKGPYYGGYTLNLSEYNSYVNYGYIGDNLLWYIDSSYNLHLVGGGDMWDMDNLTYEQVMKNPTLSQYEEVIKSVIIDSDDSGYIGYGNALYKENSTGYTLIKCFGGSTVTEFTALSDTNDVSKGAFSGCENLTDLTVPLSIPLKDMFNDDVPENIALTASGESICSDALSSVEIASLLILDSVETIGDIKYVGSNTLDVVLGTSITSIGSISGNIICGVYEDSYSYTYVKDNMDGKYYIIGNVLGLKIKTEPTKLEYVINYETLDTSGLSIVLEYGDDCGGIIEKEISLDEATVTGFDNSTAGENTITVKYKDYTATFKVTIIPRAVSGISIITLPDKLTYTVDDSELDLTGGVLQLTYNDTTTEETEILSSMVSDVSFDTLGEGTVTVTYLGFNTSFSITIRGRYILGDFNQDEKVTDSDAIYLLYYTFFPDEYPLNQEADFNRDGKVTDSDAIYLLYYTFFPDEYPLVG